MDSYRRAAEFLKINDVEVVSVQHEFGIHGGPAGSHLLELLREVQIPVVTTLHPVLSEPNDDQRRVMEQLAVFSNRFIVMAERGQRMLETIDGVDPAKIDLIPHGVIDLPLIDSNFYKDVFGVEGKTVLLTFGLSDTVCTITPVALDELLGALQWNPGAPGGGGTAWAARQLTGRDGPARPPGAAPR